MKIPLLAFSLLLCLSHCASEKYFTPSDSVNKIANKNMKIQYPKSQQQQVINNYFGTEISDPYRWLENDLSPETAEWVSAQNKVTFDYLDKIPFREKIKNRLAQLLDYERISAPFQEGNYTYFYKNDGLQNQAVLYRQKEDESPELFLDPNTLSDDGSSSLDGTYFSENGLLMTYLISEGGSDWRTAVTINTDTQQEVTSRLVNIKFSDIAWLGNQGFYYSSYDKPEGSELSAKTEQHKIYFHTIGSTQTDDKLIFGGTENEKNRYVGAQVSEDNRYLIISAANSTSGNKLYIKDLSKADNPLITVLDNVNSDTYFLDNEGTRLLLETNLDAPNKRVIQVDANMPTPNYWQDLIPETDKVLDAVTGGGYIFAQYMVDAVSQVKQLDKTGKIIREISLPDVGKASGFSGKAGQRELYFSFTNYKTPNTIYSLIADSGESKLYRKPKVDFDADGYTSKQIFYPSKDGTKIPMILTFKKGIQLNGKNPTILYGYGGFNISLQPSFSAVNAVWLEQGGIYAVANLRGGGEYGKQWHKAGITQNKQNVFDDFIAAAEYLIKEQYTSSDYLAIRGGSNGGLLVGAVMLQRPELFKVALPAVGVLDMLRYHTFTAGAGWAYDYGTAEQSKEMFEYLLGYSPVHNVKSGVNYPATLITTGDHDDRVVPAHSFKFAAHLQQKHTGPNPTLIRIETNAGHGAGTPISKTIEQYADIFGFTLYNMGLAAK
ncbi:prolyl oligopeptidase family serine peptidase [Paraglaciecola sp. L3A3]|uniref:prolyl oligopeptidase family serine peptidase n=1 Tax=Paraglaciecola sp. L3A3 TaxID=2686358 RepID=UPI00131CBB4D